MKPAKVVALGTSALALLAGVLTFLVPTPPTGVNSHAFHASLLLAVIIAVVQFGAAFLFYWGLKGFKHELRVAYGFTCAGMLVLGLSNLQLPIITYLSLTESTYVESGLIAVPYIAPALLSFFGVVLFAKLFKVKSIWMSFRFVMVLSIVSAAAAGGLTVITDPPGTADLGGSIVLSVWTGIFLLASLIVVMKVKNLAGILYQDALGWFVAGRVTVVVSGFSYGLLLIVFGNQHPLHEYGAVLVPSVISSFLFLRSGYAFKLINEDPGVLPRSEAASIIDIITFVASQASNPSELDDDLNKLRMVTATMDADNRVPTTKQEEMLKQVYGAIEQYLANKEPIRRLTIDEIRRKGALHFGMDDVSFVTAITPKTVSGRTS